MQDLELIKADIDSAFRRVPIRPDHRKFAHIILRVGEEIYSAVHLVMMFGSIASVHNWHRVAALLRTIGRRILKIPLHVFVDDYFTVDYAGVAGDTLNVFDRLVRACLGPDATSPRKLEFGNPLEILGELFTEVM